MKIGDKVKFVYHFPEGVDLGKCAWFLKENHKYSGTYIGDGRVSYKGYIIYMGDENLIEIPQKEKKPKEKKVKTVPKAKRLSKLRKECDKLWSEAVRARDGNKCVLCGSTSHCQAHHWCHTKAQGNATRWDINNGITLCYTCHLYKVHSGAAYYMDMAKNTAIRIIGQKAYEELVTPKEPRVFNESEMIEIKNHLTDLKNGVE